MDFNRRLRHEMEHPENQSRRQAGQIMVDMVNLELASAVTIVKHVLLHVNDLKWRLGTTGVFTITLSDDLVINIFDHDQAVPGRADYHSHWYDFKSDIIAGKLRHFRYVKAETGLDVLGQEVSMTHQPIGSPFALALRECPCETYLPGDSYEITSPEIHRVIADPGTVTLVTRQRKTSPTGYWVFKDRCGQEPADSPQQAPPEQHVDTALQFVALALGKMEEHQRHGLPHSRAATATTRLPKICVRGRVRPHSGRPPRGTTSQL